MNCPTCDVPLERVKYENVSVSQCPQCKGYLVNRNRLILIKTTQDHSPETLQAEVSTQSYPDAQSIIRCPKCRGRNMSKERIPVETDNDFYLDVCRNCNVVWFDGGELARLQIQYESSTKALEAFAFQQKAQHRTKEQEEEFQQNLAALPKAEHWLISAFYEKLLAITVTVLFVMTAIFFYFDFPNWATVATSLGCAFSLGRLCVRMINGGIIRLTSLIIVTAVEVSFLGYLFYY